MFAYTRLKTLDCENEFKEKKLAMQIFENEKENKLAVILVNYNGLSDTVECIRSIKQSSVKSKIVVVDNASKQNESLAINELYPDVQTFRSEQNLGFAGGNNVGIKWAIENKFEYIALLNNDTIIESNMLEVLLQHASRDSVVVPFMYYYSSPRKIWFGGGRVNKIKGNPEHFEKEKKGKFFCSFLTGCCFLMHRNIWESVGFLDETYFMYHEDTDYSIRLIQKGFNIMVVPDAKLYHKVGKSSGNRESAFSIYYNTRNRILILKKYKSFFYPTAYIFTLLSRTMRMMMLALKGRKEWKAFYGGVRDALQGKTGFSRSN